MKKIIILWLLLQTRAYAQIQFIETATGIPFTMRHIASGAFAMGSNGADLNERPVHRVELSAYYVAETELTTAQYCIFLNDIANSLNISADGDTVRYLGKILFNLYCGSYKGGCNSYEEKIEYQNKRFSVKKGAENEPIVLVSWEGAMAYCLWLSRKSGRLYRLPTEAEWEFAARAKQNTLFSGHAELDSVGWYATNTNRKIQQVRKKRPNDYGLYDMSGNVWEWCLDWYSLDYTLHTASINPKGVETGIFRVLRGGSWNLDETYSTASKRYGRRPMNCSSIAGFRLVCAKK
jgi:formylglycine-generating enzyme